MVNLQSSLVLVGAAAFAAAFGPGEHSVFDRAAHRGAVAAAVGEHLLAALLSESIEALAAQFQQLFALDVAQLLPAHQVVSTSLVAGDAIAGEHLAHHARRFRRAMSCAGAGLAVAWQIHVPGAP